LYEAGEFAKAEKVYLEILEEDPRNPRALSGLGYIALLANRLNEAEGWLTEAVDLRPEEKALKSSLAEVYHRRDEFQKAAPLLRAIGREAMADKLESFGGATPYEIEGEAEATELEFVATDPLPVVRVKVNGVGPVNFFIDTGGSEVIIDAEFAEEIGADLFGSETGTFAGGRKAGFTHGRVDSLALGGLTVRNVPVCIMGVRRFSRPIFGGRRVDGIIGTVLLYHFISMLDYPGGRLVLWLKTGRNLERIEEEAAERGSIVVPFWMAGDHYMVAWGRVNGSSPMLFFVDTGLAGGGFSCPESTLRAAGIELLEEQAAQGIGAGGKVRVVPFVADELTLGDAKEHKIRGMYSGSFPLEDALGFHIGGLISHGFFRRYSLTIDFTGMRYFLRKTDLEGRS
jgi:predicted aspartyl protease